MGYELSSTMAVEIKFELKIPDDWQRHYDPDDWLIIYGDRLRDYIKAQPQFPIVLHHLRDYQQTIHFQPFLEEDDTVSVTMWFTDDIFREIGNIDISKWSVLE